MNGWAPYVRGLLREHNLSVDLGAEGPGNNQVHLRIASCSPNRPVLRSCRQRQDYQMVSTKSKRSIGGVPWRPLGPVIRPVVKRPVPP